MAMIDSAQPVLLYLCYMSMGSNPTSAQVIIHENVKTEFLNLAVLL